MILQQLWEETPGFQEFCHQLWKNFSPPRPFAHIAARTNHLLATQNYDWAAEAQEWSRRKLLPEPARDDLEFVGFLWQSPLFLTLLNAFEFFPPSNVNLRQHLLPALSGIEEFPQRREEMFFGLKSGKIGRGTAAYWKNVLIYQAPELFLEPFLPSNGPLLGCDVACGWGRIALALPHYENRRVLACDLSQACLDSLALLIQSSQLQDKVTPSQADILHMPFADDTFDFFTAFDIYEHLSLAQVVQSVQELLRCAKKGAVLYTEIPLECFCPALTHVQNWTASEVHKIFQSQSYGGKRLQLKLTHRYAPEHMTFVVT